MLCSAMRCTGWSSVSTILTMVNPLVSTCAFSVPLFSSRAARKLQGMYPNKKKQRLLNFNALLVSSQTSTVKAQKLGNRQSAASNGVISCNNGLNVEEEDYWCSCSFSNVVVLVGYWVGPDPDDGWGYVVASLNQTH